MKLSILICTMPSRKESFDKLVDSIEAQFGKHQIEVLYNSYIDLSIGEKRNMLLHFSKSKYVAFVDDDDTVSPDYIRLLMQAIETDCDCASLKGEYSVNGKFDGIFEHSIKYKEWITTTNKIKYERYPNHLNMIRSSIAKQFKFPEINHGEDENWSTQIYKSGLLKTEFYIPEIIYYYRKVTNHAILAK